MPVYAAMVSILHCKRFSLSPPWGMARDEKSYCEQETYIIIRIQTCNVYNPSCLMFKAQYNKQTKYTHKTDTQKLGLVNL